MQTTQLHEDKFFKVLWDERNRIMSIDWKEATSSMTDEEFRAALTLFAGYVEQKKAGGILVDVSRFRHKPGPDVQPWRVKNMKQSAPDENFLTGAFDDVQKAEAWLTGKA